jgi:peptide/nickel transport system substrate-binding protein
MMKNARNLAILALVLLIGFGTLFTACNKQTSSAGGAVDVFNLPRSETLYYNGLQWGSPSGNNPDGSNTNQLAAGGHRQLVYESLFTYNLLDGKLYPQIGDSYSWNDRTLTVQLNRNVKFRDGTPLTSADVVYCYELAKTYSIGASGYWTYIDSVTAQGDYTIVIQAKAPPNFNMKSVEQSISEFSITSSAYWKKKIADGDLGREPSALIGFPAWDCVGSGPYRPLYHDDTKLVVVRNDDYWGKHSSRYGKLPAPKYVAHNIYKDNATGDAALRRGEVDVSQQFVAQIWTYANDSIETFIPPAPYYIPGVIPSIIFNTTKPGLNDKAVRKAIAMVLDYDMIGTNAMSGYTAKKQASLMLPSAPEQALIDLAALAPFQWEGIDVAGANKLLDDAGWVRGADGVRAKGGVRLSFRAECPEGWSDWNASLEVVAQSTRAIGIDVTTYFPVSGVWDTDRLNCTFDIIMDSPGGQGISSPWSRANAVMGSSYLPPAGTPNAVGNYGRWVNDRANQLIDQIANEPNAATLKTLWTELNQIYLDEMPAAGLMYRPWLFHQVSTRTWTGFPKLGDGSNVPPTIMCDGYGIKGLYNLKVK